MVTFISRLWEWFTSNWHYLGTWVGAAMTFGAVLAALTPIYRAERRRKAEARVLRIRLLATLRRLFSSILSAVERDRLLAIDAFSEELRMPLVAYLTGDEFLAYAARLEPLMVLLPILERAEHQPLAVLFDDLQNFALRNVILTKPEENARLLLHRIDACMQVLDKYGAGLDAGPLPADVEDARRKLRGTKHPK